VWAPPGGALCSTGSFLDATAEMCGLAGLIDPSGGRTAEELRGLARAMADRLVHRGPDDSGSWVDPAVGVALGHRRLSIVDLSEAGLQPMVSADGRWVLAYNGELYNTPELRNSVGLGARDLRGHSDTEVLLEAIARRGVEPAVRQAIGMFAFAAWDVQRRELWLGRDRFGEKPLFYGHHDGALLFGSELKALSAVTGFRPSVDPDSLVELLRWSCVPAPWTIYHGVWKVRPGHVVRFDAAGHLVEDIPYWSPVDVALGLPVNGLRGEDAVDELEDLLGTTVAARMVSDVPLGAFLSGGIDSSTVVSIMAGRSSHPVRTFTIGFTEPAYDESPYARKVAEYLGTDHHELVVSPADARQVIPMLATMYDEPFADSSQVPTFLLSQLAREHVTVALSGDGGDELFGGYDRYRHLDRLRGVHHRLPSPVRRLVAAVIGGIPSERWDRWGEGALGRLGPAVLRRRLGHRAHKVARVLGASGVDDVYRAMMAAENDAGSLVRGSTGRLSGAFEGSGLSDRSGFEQAMLMDTLTYLPDDLLTKVDRASMAVSLEARVPFLDPAVFEFAWRLHPDDRVRDGRGKWVVRRLLHRHVPAELVERPKMGFGIPVGEWLRGPLRAWADDLLEPSLLAEQGYLDPVGVTNRWRAHRDQRDDLVFQLWPILMFQAWLSEEAS
jgi:asparagine synthase (glutamine-hydrolysing)